MTGGVGLIGARVGVRVGVLVRQLLMVTLLLGATACSDEADALPGLEPVTGDVSVDHDFVIPAGTGGRLDDGEVVEVLPARLVGHVGEVLRIVNEDDRGHLVGAFLVEAGATLTQRFTSPGRFTGECSVHPSGQFVLEVRP